MLCGFAMRYCTNIACSDLVKEAKAGKEQQLTISVLCVRCCRLLAQGPVAGSSQGLLAANPVYYPLFLYLADAQEISLAFCSG
jgi:hypothetical protein